MWFRCQLSHDVLAAVFGVSRTTVERAIDRVRIAFMRDFVPKWLGFGPEHAITADDTVGDLSSWMGKKIGDDVWDLMVVGVMDGTYIYCQTLNDFLGNKFFYSVHKHRPLSKVWNILKLVSRNFGLSLILSNPHILNCMRSA